MYRSVTTSSPRASAGPTSSATCWARSAAKRSASAPGVRASSVGSRTMSLMRRPTSVPPGSRVSTAPRSAARRAACVDLPDASPPSKTMRRPLAMSIRCRDLMAAQGVVGEHAGADDDRPAQPESETYAGQLNGEPPDVELPRRQLVEASGQERADGESDDEAQADERVQGGEHPASDLVGHVLLDEREAH